MQQRDMLDSGFTFGSTRVLFVNCLCLDATPRNSDLACLGVEGGGTQAPVILLKGLQVVLMC